MWWIHSDCKVEEIKCGSCHTKIIGPSNIGGYHHINKTPVTLCESCEMLFSEFRSRCSNDVHDNSLSWFINRMSNQAFIQRLDNKFKETLEETPRWSGFQAYLRSEVDRLQREQDIKQTEKETGWIYKPSLTCDKCHATCIDSDMDYIYSTKKIPYYRICQKCSRLFHDYVQCVPRGYEGSAYLNAVKYMFKED